MRVIRASQADVGGSVHLSAILALLSFAMMIVSLDQYIVVVALPDIGRDLGYSPQTPDINECLIWKKLMLISPAPIAFSNPA